ncbi:Cyclic nucleotide-binding domain-containing protein 2 [Paramecium bursaria]
MCIINILLEKILKKISEIISQYIQKSNLIRYIYINNNKMDQQEAPPETLLQRTQTQVLIHPRKGNKKLTTSSTKTGIPDELLNILEIMKLRWMLRTKKQQEDVKNFFEKTFNYFEKFQGSLSEEYYNQLFQVLEVEECRSRQILFKQGETGRKMFFILFGEVAILVNTENQQTVKGGSKFDAFIEQNLPKSKIIAIKEQGHYFGEIAIEQRVPRTASVVCKSFCVFGVLTFASYNQLIRSHQNDALKMKYEILRQFEPFNEWPEQEIFLLVHSCEDIKQYVGNQVIFKRFQQQNTLYLILEGEVLLQKFEKANLDEHDSQRQVSRITNIGCFGRGQIFGDYEIFKGKFANGNILRVTQAIAKNNTKVILIPIHQYIQSMKDNMGESQYSEYLQQKYGQQSQWWKPNQNIQLTQKQQQKSSYLVEPSQYVEPKYIQKGFITNMIPRLNLKYLSPKVKDLDKSNSNLQSQKLQPKLLKAKSMICRTSVDAIKTEKQITESQYQPRIINLLKRQLTIKNLHETMQDNLNNVHSSRYIKTLPNETSFNKQNTISFSTSIHQPKFKVPEFQKFIIKP